MAKAYLIRAALLLLQLGGTALADGPVIITQSKAVAGHVTPGDAPGFPITISAPGSYKLGNNLDVAAGKNGIVVTAPHVTIDLDGFTLNGNQVALHGILLTGLRKVFDVSVRNGSISEFTKRGISAEFLNFVALENLTILGNGTDGVVVGNYARIANSTISVNFGTGVACVQSCSVQSSVVSSNGGVGIEILEGHVLGNAIEHNRSLGISATSAGAGNNTLIDNNTGHPGAQTRGIYAMQPNLCLPECLFGPPFSAN
jgi:hypothetical protein